jgi:hypothetical protein
MKAAPTEAISHTPPDYPEADDSNVLLRAPRHLQNSP